jgi:glutamate--cysteine ligase catalytic subunit
MHIWGSRGDADLWCIRRALGTPLNWPEAQKKADQVRKWGIEVRVARSIECTTLMGIDSNYWRFGTGPRVRRRTLCYGVTRLVILQAWDMLLKHSQIEYLVVNYKAEDPNVTLSLHQADILHALAHDEKLVDDGGCVPDLQDVDQRLDPSLG